MNKAELAEIVNPGYKWLVEWDAMEPKPKHTRAEIIRQAEKAMDELKNIVQRRRLLISKNLTNHCTTRF